jgi:hypothetical protein
MDDSNVKNDVFLFRGTQCVINLEERGSTKLYAQVDVDIYPGPAVQSVSDSSRYVIQLNKKIDTSIY